jgi:hypothetical protein
LSFSRARERKRGLKIAKTKNKAYFCTLLKREKAINQAKNDN